MQIEVSRCFIVFEECSELKKKQHSISGSRIAPKPIYTKNGYAVFRKSVKQCVKVGSRKRDLKAFKKMT